MNAIECQGAQAQEGNLRTSGMAACWQVAEESALRATVYRTAPRVPRPTPSDARKSATRSARSSRAR